MSYKNKMLNQPIKKSFLEFNVNIRGVNLTQKSLFARHLSVMLKAGLTLLEALEIIQEQASGKFKKILTKILLSVKSGQSLSDSFACYPKVFSGLFVNVTRAGEASGTLEENLSNIAEQLEKDRELLSKVKGAMFYPIVVSIVAFGLGLALSFFVLPKITPLFEGLKMDLPFTTRGLIWFSNFIRNHGVWLFWGIIAFVVFFVWLIQKKFSRTVTHWILLHTPIVSKIVKESNLTRFCRTLGMLIKSGLNIDEALEISKTTLNNYYFQKSLDKVSRHVARGTKITEAMAEFEYLYPKIMTRMIKVGEKSGKLEETLFYLANFYETEVDNSTKSLSTIIEPVLLVVIGLLVAFLALSIITPIYEITGRIKH